MQLHIFRVAKEGGNWDLSRLVGDVDDL